MNIEKIYQIYFDDIYRFMLSIAKNRYIAEDITSETFLKVINNPDKFEDISNLKAYLFTIAKNTYINYYKRNKIYISTDDLEKFESASESFEQELLYTEKQVVLKKLIEKLGEPYRSIVKLRLEELSFKDIAKIYNKSQNRACVSYYRAKEKLKIMMEEEYGM